MLPYTYSFKQCSLFSTTLTMDSAEKIQAASNFLLQSPPGQINDVLNGMFDDSELRRYATPAIVFPN